MQQPSQEAQGTVGRRVYFLSGFDPRGATFYYRHFADQLQTVSSRIGHPLSLSRRRGVSDRLASRWQVLSALPGSAGPRDLDYCFLHWDDIARLNWPRSPLALLADGVPIYWWYLARGGLWKVARMSKKVALCGLYPVLYALSALLAAALIGSSIAFFVTALGLPALGPSVLGLVVVVLSLAFSWRLGESLGVVWLLRSIRFTHELGQNRDGGLKGRVEELADRILNLEAQDGAAEVLLVGHSSGSFVMAMLAAALRRRTGFKAIAPRVRLLSLAQNLANLAVYEGAGPFHADLLSLSQEPRLPWRDVTSADDFLCFAGVDPYRSCAVPIPPPPYPQLELIPLAQRQGLTSLPAVLSRQFSLHFEYLATADPQRSGGFDYFAELLAPLPSPLCRVVPVQP